MIRNFDNKTRHRTIRGLATGESELILASPNDPVNPCSSFVRSLLGISRPHGGRRELFFAGVKAADTVRPDLVNYSEYFEAFLF